MQKRVHLFTYLQGGTISKYFLITFVQKGSQLKPYICSETL